MKAILWILLLVFLALWAAYPFVFHCSYGWDVEQMWIACKGKADAITGEEADNAPEY